MVADRHDAFTIELSPRGFEYIERDENSAVSFLLRSLVPAPARAHTCLHLQLCHSNHFISPTMHKKSNEVELWLADSPLRLAKIRETLGATSDLSHTKIRELLSDRSNGQCSICRHEGGDGVSSPFSSGRERRN